MAAPLMPRSEEDFAALVRDFARSGKSILTEGNGTKRHFGPCPAEGATTVCTRGLDRVVEYEPGDMVVTVQAGARLRDVQRVLAEHGQWLAMDPPFGDATIGGIIATRSAGPRRLAYGTIKDCLLGTRTVTAGGEVTKSGGRVVKNVSGYDLHRLHVGAYGTLGVVVEASLKVSARPEASAALLLAEPTLDGAHQVLLDVAKTALRPSALEAFDASAADAIEPPPVYLKRGHALALIGIEGPRAIVDRHLRDLERVRTKTAASVVVEGTELGRLWDWLRDEPARHGADITVRVGARPHDLPHLLTELRLLATEPLALERARVIVQAAVGIARVSWPAPGDASPIVAPLKEWQRAAEGRGGYAVVESAPLELAGRSTLPWTSTSGRLDPLGPLIRRSWDPGGVVNQGRMAS